MELANRLEEARTSAKLLTQVVQCTAPSEILGNDLIPEFANRCLSASRSIQDYMAAQNPAPDNDTMESLLDTNEQLQQALNLHQRAMLNAKKHLGLGDPSTSAGGRTGGSAGGSARGTPPPINGMSKPQPLDRGKGKATDNQVGTSRSHSGTPPRPTDETEDPFRDPQPESSRSSSKARTAVASGAGAGVGPAAAAAAAEPRLGFEPFHPGFNARPSYIARRQESAINNTTMHGADVSPIQDDDSPVATTRHEDFYGASDSGAGRPVYRY